VNNASAIWLRGTLDTPMKRFDLMQQVNARGSFLCAQACLPHLLEAPNPHILTLAPPPSLDPKWWAPHTGYTLAKMGMSFVTLGLAAEFGPQGVAVNALWPRTIIGTDALNMIPGVEPGNGRSPEIMGDAAHAVLVRPAADFAGNFLIDDEVLAEAGVTDLAAYACDLSKPPSRGLSLDCAPARCRTPPPSVPSAATITCRSTASAGWCSNAAKAPGSGTARAATTSTSRPGSRSAAWDTPIPTSSPPWSSRPASSGTPATSSTASRRCAWRRNWSRPLALPSVCFSATPVPRPTRRRSSWYGSGRPRRGGHRSGG